VKNRFTNFNYSYPPLSIYYQKGPYYRCILVANKLPEKNINEVDNVFKRELKNLLLNKCYYSIDE
jgi:hypothetical protein